MSLAAICEWHLWRQSPAEFEKLAVIASSVVQPHCPREQQSNYYVIRKTGLPFSVIFFFSKTYEQSALWLLDSKTTKIHLIATNCNETADKRRWRSSFCAMSCIQLLVGSTPFFSFTDIYRHLQTESAHYTELWESVVSLVLRFLSKEGSTKNHSHLEGKNWNEIRHWVSMTL